MDNIYLKNLNGSPFVNEGLWDKIKSLYGFGKSPNPPSEPTPPPTPENPEISRFINDIIDKTMETVINAVKKDSWRSAPYFNKEGYLPTDYDDPKWDDIKKSHFGISSLEYPSEIPAGIGKGKRGGDEEEDKATLEPQPEPPPTDEGGFLYNFHANYNKNRTFTIPVGGFDVIYNGAPKHFDVLWSTHGDISSKHAYINSIMVRTISEKTGTLKNITIFEFFDHYADTRTPQGKEFDVRNLLYKDNPKLKQYYKDNPILSLEFKKAIMATVNRKSMEFKANKWDKNIKQAIRHFVPKIGGDGGVSKEEANEIEEEAMIWVVKASQEFKKTGEKPSIDKLITRAKTLKLAVTGEPLKEPVIPSKPIPTSPTLFGPLPPGYEGYTPAMIDAVAALVKLGYKTTDSKYKIEKAVADLGISAKDSVEKLVNYALSSKVPPEPPKTSPSSIPTPEPKLSSEPPKGDIINKKPEEPSPAPVSEPIHPPVVDKNKKTVVWNGKTYKFGEMLPKELYQLLQKQGIDWKSLQKPKMEGLINPWNSSNFI